MAINFPNTPTSGDIHNESSRSWIWDTVSWNPYTSAATNNVIVASFSPLDNEPPSTNYATLDTRNNRPVLDFNDTTQEASVFCGVVPTGINLTNGLTIVILAAATTATTGTIGWDVAFERVVANDIDADSDNFGTPQTITAVTVSGTSGVLTSFSITFTQGQLPASLAAEDLFRIRIRRDVANDTATDDAELFFVELHIPN